MEQAATHIELSRGPRRALAFGYTHTPQRDEPTPRCYSGLYSCEVPNSVGAISEDPESERWPEVPGRAPAGSGFRVSLHSPSS